MEGLDVLDIGRAPSHLRKDPIKYILIFKNHGKDPPIILSFIHLLCKTMNFQIITRILKLFPN